MNTKLFDRLLIGPGEQALDFIGNILEASTEYSIIGKEVQPDCVYVLPPNRDMSIRHSVVTTFSDTTVAKQLEARLRQQHGDLPASIGGRKNPASD